MTGRVLHLTAWYPSGSDPLSVPFIDEHVRAINRHFDHSTLIHIDLYRSQDFSIGVNRLDDQSYRIYATGKFIFGRIAEIICLFFLFVFRVGHLSKTWDLVVVHIAWPILSYPRFFNFLFGKKVLVIEHWSAYKKNFYLSLGSAAHLRMCKMFEADARFVAVSRDLANEIKRFSRKENLEVNVVPNVVSDAFVFKSGNSREYDFVMAANWNDFREPLLVLEAFQEIVFENRGLRLAVIGYGAKLPRMKQFVNDSSILKEQVFFLGRLPKKSIAKVFDNSKVFLHPANYETFSVISAEALCSGLPALVSKTGALRELVTESLNGYLIENSVSEWKYFMELSVDEAVNWDRAYIAKSARSLYSSRAVGARLVSSARETG